MRVKETSECENKFYNFRLKGVMFVPNAQKIIKQEIKKGMMLFPVTDPLNKFDKYAVKLCIPSRYDFSKKTMELVQVGWVPRTLSEQITKQLLNKNREIVFLVNDVLGGGELNWGVSVNATVYFKENRACS